MALYPGSDGSLSESDLSNFVENSSEGEFKSADDVAQYHREFSKIANRLGSELTSSELDHYHKQSIRLALYQHILQHSFVAGQPPIRSSTREEIYSLAVFIADQHLWRRRVQLR
ncbi:hypothetical protein MSAN_00371900 [Mycena sanguinolenta]|uniref:Uncharacterized protein n=1 Tax=Mycena sanguinolenta TaxID=230812 RepID=A0A8H7DGS2_9AGAR|nr:hypothetical protein MSAN_00371900 [Mycena sanguinolenta]